ncbi:hypothetical protein CEXT_529311 [Caerostris extrusa]|uniref:Transposase n=1 Tax=Caerostris extrusa TaxID=172846 RepID=A0AAV4RTD0_CAEEX|nr:hypothetical protein CEXT_529311 [Caerostris extrusa]
MKTLVNNRECIFLSLQLDDDNLFPKAPALSRSKLTRELSASDINLGRAVLIYWFIAAEPKWQLRNRIERIFLYIKDSLMRVRHVK